MKIISFDPFRSIGIPHVSYIKPELTFRERDLIQSADWILYPEYWQVNFLAYAWNKQIFPNINSYHLGHDKIEMTRSLEAIVPNHVPYTIIAPSDQVTKERVLEELGYPFVAKEVRNSMGKGVYLIENNEQFNDYLSNNKVAYIQEYLPNDRDLRVVFLGDKVISAYWRIGQGSFKNNVSQGGIIDFSTVPRETIELVEYVATTLGINHAGFDLTIVGNRIYFFEFNVLFGNQALLQANVPVAKHIYDFLNQYTIPKPPTPWLPGPGRIRAS